MKNVKLVVTGVLVTSLLFLKDCVRGENDFVCPEEFGYYQHPSDCSKYYVCVFGGPLLESCTGGLMYSHELQTCDWPRNVVCVSGKRNGEIFDTDDEDHERVPRLLVEDVNFGQRENVVPVTSSTTSRTTQAVEIDRLLFTSDEEDNESSLLFDSDDSYYAKTTESGIVERSFSSSDAYDDVDVFADDLEGRHSQRVDEEKEEDLFDAKSTELLHSPPVYESDIDTVDQDFYDYAVAAAVPDDDFYYVSWDNPIYDDFEQYDYSDPADRNRRLTGTNITVDYNTRPPLRPPLLRPELRYANAGEQATNCKNQKCHLPDCLCGQTRLKEMASTLHRPQLVILTFDDSVNDLNRDLYKEIFRHYRVNPNGCPISSTFFVSHEWTDYSQVQNLYASGHEIASHSISHSYGEQFSKKKWLKEMVGQRELLSAFAGIPLEDIRGMRAPFLAIGGDNMFEMMYEANFTYDSSMPIYDNRPPAFPYTLDYKMPHDCMIPPCPEKSYPGLWEIPLVMWNDLGNGRCSMLDACSNPSKAEDVYKLLWQNFARHYNTNRAPIGLFYHAAWFTQPHNMEGFQRFLDTILSLNDVWFVTSWQAIQWMRNLANPVDPLNFEPFQCKQTREQRKAMFCTKPKVCNLWHKSGVRYMRTCQRCPPNYPWTGNTGISNSRSGDLYQ
eukprot:07656.XXX_165687_149673_1 [CDS] Oithona nana genome sequencing.